ncbi:tachykinin-like peptides receptor 86C [Hydractinia symbiolongicarpus]|uniref:tachykinin-like peptides receptor 86C n=1 Tax=Hydractinia symbiolongicarpus TaxID=13093 RepID=UPI00254D06CB|nr:tachykinin-like peptides receptor 86C [Hydractinia symbiolongicarpus]
MELYKIVAAIVDITCILLHGCLITVVLKTKKIRKVRSNQLLINLCIGHWLIAFFDVFGHFVRHFSWIEYSMYVLMISSLYVLTTDRFVSIKFPMKYQNMNICLHLMWMSCSWIIAILFVIISYLKKDRPKTTADDKNTMMLFLSAIMFTIVSMTIMNSIIFAVVRRQTRAIASLQVQANQERRNEIQRNFISKKEKRQFYICYGIVITFSILWLPTVAVALNSLIHHQPVKGVAFSWSVRVANANALLDPIVFFWFNKDIRAEINKILTKTKEETSETNKYIMKTSCSNAAVKKPRLIMIKFGVSYPSYPLNITT